MNNDLISRSELKEAVDTWDKFGYTAKGELIRLTEENKDLYVPYVKYQDIVNCIDNAPTVEPKQGEWIEIKHRLNLLINVLHSNQVIWQNDIEYIEDSINKLMKGGEVFTIGNRRQVVITEVMNVKQ